MSTTRPGPRVYKQGSVKRAPSGKLSAFKKWEKKWMVFAVSTRSGPVLDFFDDRSDMVNGPSSAARIVLEDTKQVCAAIDCKVPHSFIVVTEERILTLAAQNSNDRDGWISILRRVLTERDCLASGTTDHQYGVAPRKPSQRRRAPTPPPDSSSGEENDPVVEAHDPGAGTGTDSDAPAAGPIYPFNPPSNLQSDDLPSHHAPEPPRHTSPTVPERLDTRSPPVSPLLVDLPPRPRPLPDDEARRNIQQILEYNDDYDTTYESGDRAAINEAASIAISKQDCDAAVRILSTVKNINEAARRVEPPSKPIPSLPLPQPPSAADRVEFDFSPSLTSRPLPRIPTQVSTKVHKADIPEPSTSGSIRPLPRRRISVTNEKSGSDVYTNAVNVKTDSGVKARPAPLPRGSGSMFSSSQVTVPKTEISSSPHPAHRSAGRTKSAADAIDDSDGQEYENRVAPDEGMFGHGVTNERAMSRLDQSASTSRYDMVTSQNSGSIQSGRQITQVKSNPAPSDSDSEDCYDFALPGLTGISGQDSIDGGGINGRVQATESYDIQQSGTRAVDNIYEDTTQIAVADREEFELDPEPASQPSPSSIATCDISADLAASLNHSPTAPLPQDDPPPPYTPARLLNQPTNMTAINEGEGSESSQSDFESPPVKPLPAASELIRRPSSSISGSGRGNLPTPDGSSNSQQARKGDVVRLEDTFPRMPSPSISRPETDFNTVGAVNLRSKDTTLQSKRSSSLRKSLSSVPSNKLKDKSTLRSLSSENLLSYDQPKDTYAHVNKTRKASVPAIRSSAVPAEYDLVIPSRQKATKPAVDDKDKGQSVSSKSSPAVPSLPPPRRSETAKRPAKPESLGTKVMAAGAAPSHGQKGKRGQPLDGGELLKEGNTFKPPNRQSQSCLPLRQSQIELLKEEVSHSSGVKVTLWRSDAKHILFVDIQNSIWVAGWNQKKKPLLHNLFHLGDKIISVNNEAVSSSSRLLQLVKRADSETRFEIVVRRLPFAKAYFIHRNIDGEDIGLQLLHETSEICGIQPGSLCAKQGLRANPNKAFGEGQCHWIVTEINHRPISLQPAEGEASARLAARGRDITFVVQPQDLIESIKRQLKSSFGWRDYLVS